jgi:hypothetical protein
LSLSRFNEGIVGGYPATKDQRRLRESRSALLGKLKQRSDKKRSDERLRAVQRRIDAGIQAAAIRENARRDRNA